MSALTADRRTKSRAGVIVTRGIKANTRIFGGSIVCKDTSGYAVPAADTANYRVLGIAQEQVDNRAGSDLGGLANAAYPKCERNAAFLLACTGADHTWVNRACYVVDDQTVAISGTTNAVYVGVVIAVDSATAVWVFIPPMAGTIATASDVGIVDAGNLITATEVEAALQEMCGAGRTTETLKSISDHTTDASAAHAASAISFTPVGAIAATDAQAAIAEVATDANTAMELQLGGATSRMLTVYEFWYDFATHAGAQGTITLTKRGGAVAQALPDNFVPIHVAIEQELAFTSGGAATVKFGIGAVTDAIISEQDFNHAQYAINKVNVGTVATSLLKTTGATNFTMTIMNADITAGRVIAYVLGFQGA